MAIQTQINALLSDQVFAIYNNAETLMLEKVAKRVQKGLSQPGWNERKLQDVQAMRKEIEAITMDVDKLIKTKLSKGLKDAYSKGMKSAEKDLNLPATILSDTHVPFKLQRLVLETNNLVSNSSFKILRNTEDAYRRLQAEVTAGTLTGVETQKQIAKRFLNRLADQGITSFTDKRGRNWEMGSYAEMVTRTTTIQASLQGHVDRQLQAGRDLIVVSDHAGECRLCRPWENKVLSITGETNGYPSLATAKAAGLFHPNCKHTITGYIEGLTDLEPHPRTSGVPGQDLYEANQRANERAIRRWKRREVVAQDPKELKFARMKIREYQLRQRELLKAYEDKFGMTLRRKYDRESILNREGIAGIEKLPQWTKTATKDIKKKIKPREPKEAKKPLPNIKDYKNLHEESRKWAYGNLSGYSDIVKHSKFLDADRNLENAINVYTGSDYIKINNIMRGKETDPRIIKQYEFDIKEYEKLKDTPELSENIIVYRHNKISSTGHLLGDKAKALAEEALRFDRYKESGVNVSLEELKKLHKGGTLQDKAVLSTSYKDDVFTRNEGTELQILLPKGFKGGVFAENISKHKSEAEYIFKPNQKFQIIDIEIRKLRDGERNISFIVFPID